MRAHGRTAAPSREADGGARRRWTWLFDLDDTLHDASHATFGQTSAAMSEFICAQLGLSPADATALRLQYWQRYGATLLGLVRHHGVKAAHFLDETHRLPGLEQRLRCSAADRSALDRLPGEKYVLTNGPREYARRVLSTLGLSRCFRGVITIEDMVMFGQHRPKPDRRMLRHLLARLKRPAARCVLVEDTLSNQKAARRIGMRTVWMQAYLRLPGSPGRSALPGHKPSYVCARIRRIRRLHSFARTA